MLVKSNSAKSSIMDALILSFTGANSQTSDRIADPRLHTQSFKQFKHLKKDVASECKLLWFVISAGLRGNRESRSGFSYGLATNWLHTHRPKVAICPHKRDKCAKSNAGVHAKHTTLN